MQNIIDRASGLFFLIFGLVMYFFVIPSQVELDEAGMLRPDTLPNALSVIIAICGAFVALKPAQVTLPPPRQMALTLVYVALLCVAIYAMAYFGFVYVSPVLALLIMLMIGERRPLWLLGGVLVLPSTIWFFVAQLLERSLP
ncbi:MAG: hypothetical protein COA78_28140 [Blastopirellula sp.]|nr:MAG: hypothetical protein COA78_28140 [Blastopirellula sp.]